MKRFIISLTGLALMVNAHALTTVELVARTKPFIVTIKLWNSMDPNHGTEGTGFFCDTDKIMTAAHIVSGNYDRVLVNDLAGNAVKVESSPAYENDDKDVDIAILKVKNAGELPFKSFDHPYLPLATSTPLEGQNVIVIGNPQGLTGTVSTGIVSAVRDNGNLIQFTAPVSNGSSGCPVLNEDGEVIGIADWILRPQGNEIAQNLNFAHGVPVMKMAQAGQGKSNNSWNPPAAADAQPTPTPDSAPVASDVPGVVTPTKFGDTRQGPNGHTLTQVLDQPAIEAISFPVCGYLMNSASGQPSATYFLTKLDGFYDLGPCSFEQAWVNDLSYFKKWPIRSNKINFAGITVERVSWSGNTCYFVRVPFDWTVQNSKKSQSGHTITMAYVVPGWHTGNHRPDYFIGSIWNYNPKTNTLAPSTADRTPTPAPPASAPTPVVNVQIPQQAAPVIHNTIVVSPATAEAEKKDKFTIPQD